MKSLNELRARFMAGQGDEDSDLDIHTTVTITFGDGRTCEADLSIGWFDGEGPRDHIGMELWVSSETSEYDEGAGVGLDIMPSWGEHWDLDDVFEVFNIDPDAPIWEEENTTE